MGKVVAGILALVVVAGAIFYFVSDPFKTKVDMSVEQATKWTPENINRDPVGYLTWGLGQADNSIEALSARRIALSQQKSRNARMVTDDAKDLDTAKQLFEKFRTAYKEAVASGTWPTEVAGTPYTEEALKKQIVSLKSKIDSLQQQKTQLDGLQKTLDSHMDQLDARLTEAKTTKTELARKLEIVKANKAIEGLVNLRADVDGLSGVADFLAQTDAIPTVDQLIQQEQVSVSDSDFNDILNAEI